MWRFVGLLALGALLPGRALCNSSNPAQVKKQETSDPWEVVDELIDGFYNVTNMAFSAGDRSGRKHTYAKGRSTMSKRVLMASSSKFPVVIALARAISAGHLSFDTKASEVFEWWTSDPKDRRSRVTLKHLMSFTSGLVLGSVGAGNISCMGLTGVFYSSERCAKQIYNEAPFEGEPGTIWSYHSLHLQVAGALGAKATGLSLKSFLHEFVLSPMGMTRSFWLGAANPHLAATLVSCGDDYDSLLQKYLAYEAVPKEIADVLEADYTAPPIQPSRFQKDKMLLEVFGHYSMGLYLECLATNSTPPGEGAESGQLGWRPECAKQKRHSDPGAFGYWPLIDRNKDFYMQLVAMFIEPYHKGMDMNTWASLPARAIAPLRFELQHPVEHALGKSDGDDVEYYNADIAQQAFNQMRFVEIENKFGPLLSKNEMIAMETALKGYESIYI
mmetsp:Transcript_30121/g.70246  ORF Transcript_30121/g.70246 Transcript_30121/m.70246 type:complete len:444 (-) Transcript_30121:70-1401(-)